MSVTARSRRYLTDAARAFERAPGEVAAAVALAVAWSYAVAEGGMAMRAWTELLVAAALIVAAAWTGTLLHGLGAWSASRRWAVTAAGAVIAALYALLVLDLEYAAEGWRAFMLVGAALLWLLAVPAFAVRRRTGGVSDAGDATNLTRGVSGRVLLRAIGALLYCGALFAGLALAVAAVDTLFELDLDGDIFAHVFGWTFLVLGPWIVAGGVPEYVQPADPRDARAGVAGVAHRMTAYLVPPLLALYCIILYAYAVRIGVTGEVPKNLVSPMVLAAGALVALALFLFDDGAANVRGDSSPAGSGDAPVMGAPDRGLLRWVRYAPALFLPLALLGIWALWMRIDQYGWTEFRLLRVIALITFAGLAVGACVLLVRRRRYPLQLVPLTLAAVLVFAAIGPWSVTAVSERSQYGRLVSHLEAVGIDATDRDAPTSPRTVPADTYEQINSIARYLAVHHGTDALPPAVEARFGDEWQVSDVASRLGLEAEWPDIDDERGFFGRLADGEVVDIGGMTMHRVVATPERRGVPPGSVLVRQDSTLLTLTVAGEEALYVDIALFVERARMGPRRRPMRPGAQMVSPSLAAPTNSNLTGDDARIDVVDSTGALRGHLLVLHISLGTEDDALVLRQLDGLLFLRSQPAS